MGLTLFGDDAHRMTNVTGVWIPKAWMAKRCAP
jgi:aspartate aminotransferase-like enzyme